MKNPIEIYMEKVDEILKNTTDPFAKKYPEVFKTLIEVIAKENWLINGEPTLSEAQMQQVYSSAKNQTKDRTWELICGFNICMN